MKNVISKKANTLHHIDTGTVLISRELDTNGSFKKDVIVITRYDSNGASGLHLSNRLDIHAGMNIFPERPDGWEIGYGGPEACSHVTYLAGVGETTTHKPKAIFWGSSMEALEIIVSHQPGSLSSLRFFAGHQVWGPGELDFEVTVENKWWLGDISFHDLFHLSGPALWTTMLKKYGGLYSVFAGTEHEAVFPN